MAHQESPVYASKQTKDIYSGIKKLIEKLGYSKKISPLKEINDVIDNNSLSRISRTHIDKIFVFIDDKLGNSDKNLDLETKLAIKMLLKLTLKADIEAGSLVRKSLFNTIALVSKNENNLAWLFDQIISNFTESQLKKLIEAYGLDKELDIKNPSTEQMRNLAERLIILATQQYDSVKPYGAKFLNKEDSPAFFGLDNSAKEAVCWKELEFSRSRNENYSSLAAAIAWRTWLFKKPLLKELCKRKNLDHGTLNFTQRVELTKEALETFSEQEISDLLNSYIEKAIERKKSQFKVEDRPEFLNKKVSMGSEYEMGKAPYEAALIYACFEHLDRQQYEDSIDNSGHLGEIFEVFSAYKDRQHELQINLGNEAKAEKLIHDFEISDKEEGSSPEINDQQKTLEIVNILIGNILNENIKASLLQLLELGGISNDFLSILRQFLENETITSREKVEVAKKNFRNLLRKNNNDDKVDDAEMTDAELSQDDEEVENWQIQTLGNHLPIDRASNQAHILLDLFKHHMGEIQAIGQPVGYDAFGEFNFRPVSCNFKKPSRIYSQQIWEFAEAGFHDLELSSRPVHTTIGWSEDTKERNLSIESIDAIRKASVINFSLLTAGLSNMESILEVANLLAENEGEELTTIIQNFADTGRSRMVRERPDGSTYCFAVEFRGLRPRKIDQVRLADSLENLGTIMKASLVVESDVKRATDNADEIDDQLNLIWIKYENKVVEIYKMFENIPSLYDSNSWFKTINLSKIQNFYLKLAQDLDKPDGVLAQMRNLIAETTKEIEAVFEG